MRRSLGLFGLAPCLAFAAAALGRLPEQGPLSAAAAAEVVSVVAGGTLVEIPVALTALGVGAAILFVAERLALAFDTSQTLAGSGLAACLRAAPASIPSELDFARPSRPRAPPAPATP